jgi:glutamyl-tRNA synthetase
LVVGRDGKRLAKRHGDTRIASFRAAGAMPEEIIGMLAASCAWSDENERISLRELLDRFDLGAIPKRPFMV